MLDTLWKNLYTGNVYRVVRVKGLNLTLLNVETKEEIVFHRSNVLHTGCFVKLESIA